MSPETLKQKVWQKNWAGTFSLLFASFYGRNYTKGLKDLVGRSFENNLVVYEKGSCSNYLPKDELEKLCKIFAEKIISADAATEWSKEVFKQTDEVMLFMKKLDAQTSFTVSDYESLRKLYYAHVPPNFAIKKVVDYLPAELVTRYLDLFTKVRLYTEPVYPEIDRQLKRIVRFFLKNCTDELIPFITKRNLKLSLK